MLLFKFRTRYYVYHSETQTAWVRHRDTMVEKSSLMNLMSGYCRVYKYIYIHIGCIWKPGVHVVEVHDARKTSWQPRHSMPRQSQQMLESDKRCGKGSSLRKSEWPNGTVNGLADNQQAPGGETTYYTRMNYQKGVIKMSHMDASGHGMTADALTKQLRPGTDAYRLHTTVMLGTRYTSQKRME